MNKKRILSHKDMSLFYLWVWYFHWISAVWRLNLLDGWASFHFVKRRSAIEKIHCEDWANSNDIESHAVWVVCKSYSTRESLIFLECDCGLAELPSSSYLYQHVWRLSFEIIVLSMGFISRNISTLFKGQYTLDSY